MSATNLGQIIEPSGVLVLDFLPFGSVEGQWVELVVGHNVATGDEFVVVEQLRGEVYNGGMGAVVLT